MATLDIVTVEEVLANVRIPDGESALIPSYITAVSLYIDELCGPVVQRTITDEAHHGGGSNIILRRWPVVSVTSVVENGVTIAASGYHLDVESGLIERMFGSYYNWRWFYGRWNVLVTYVAGRYATTSAVDDLFSQAAIMAVKAMWMSQKAIAGTQSFGAYGGDLVENSDMVGGPQFVLPRAAYMLLRGGNQIKPKLGIA